MDTKKLDQFNVETLKRKKAKFERNLYFLILNNQMNREMVESGYSFELALASAYIRYIWSIKITVWSTYTRKQVHIYKLSIINSVLSPTSAPRTDFQLRTEHCRIRRQMKKIGIVNWAVYPYRLDVHMSHSLYNRRHLTNRKIPRRQT